MAGVDIGSCFIKTLLLSRQGQHYSVDACTVDAVPAHYNTADHTGHIIVSGNSLHHNKKTLPEDVTQVVAAVSGATVISRVIVVDSGLTDSELANRVLTEVEQLVSYSLHDVYIDFDIIGPHAADTAQSEVLLCIARADTVKHKLSQLQQQGMTASIIDIEYYALARAATLCFEQFPALAPLQPVLLLDVGASQTLFCIINSRLPLYCHDIAAGLPTPAADALAPQLPERLLQQIRQHLQRFSMQQQTSVPDYVLLSGGAALIPGMAAYLQQQLGMLTVLADPFRNMHFHTHAEQELMRPLGVQFMVACGLAMRGV